MINENLDYKYCINLAVENAKKRINLLDKSDRNCLIAEYKEWINEGFNNQSVLLLRRSII